MASDASAIVADTKISLVTTMIGKLSSYVTDFTPVSRTDEYVIIEVVKRCNYMLDNNYPINPKQYLGLLVQVRLRLSSEIEIEFMERSILAVNDHELRLIIARMHKLLAECSSDPHRDKNIALLEAYQLLITFIRENEYTTSKFWTLDTWTNLKLPDIIAAMETNPVQSPELKDVIETMKSWVRKIQG